MTDRKLQTAVQGVRGRLEVPGDKSISHRAVMLGSIADGDTYIKGILDSDDVRSTLGAMADMGVEAEWHDQDVIVHGRPLTALEEPSHALNMGNSGTSTRLLMGLLANQPFPITYSGDASLSTRPLCGHKPALAGNKSADPRLTGDSLSVTGCLGTGKECFDFGRPAS